jgi:hypothetical protein
VKTHEIENGKWNTGKKAKEREFAINTNEDATGKGREARPSPLTENRGDGPSKRSATFSGNTGQRRGWATVKK